VNDVIAQGIPAENIYFLGFSQGACLALEYSTRNAKRFGGIVALAGGLIGDKIYTENYNGNFKGTPIFIGTGDPDPHVPIQRINESEEILVDMDASVIKKVYPNKPHSISDEELDLANSLIFKR
jgi:phospholipase/carboxylesterase